MNKSSLIRQKLPNCPDPHAFFKMLVDNSGLNLNAVKEKLGGNQSVYPWYKSTSDIPADKIPEVGEAFELTPAEINHFTLLRLPCLQKAQLEEIIEPNKRAGELIKVYRNLAGLSQRELGADVGVTESNVFKWESGKNIPYKEVLLY